VQPFETLVLESLFACNIYETLKLQGEPCHFGEHAIQRLHELMSTDITERSQTAVTLDWTAFDANNPAWVVEIGLDIIEGMIDFTKMSVDGKESITFTESKADEYRRAF